MDARPFLWVWPLAFLAAACGSSSVSVTSPSAAKCQVSVPSSTSSAPAAGGTGTIDISTTRDCTWNASTTAPWISLTSSTSGQGDGSVAYRVAENAAPSVRHGTLTINDAQVQIAQDAAACTFSVSPASAAMGPSAGSVAVHVDTIAGCAWTASTSAGWLQISGAASNTGPGTATIGVAPNGGTARSGTVTVASQTVTISQNACVFAISPASRSTDANGASGTIAVTASGGCTWTAASNVPWISVASGASGTGTGSVAYAASANTGPARSGTMTVAGQTFTLTQASGCNAMIAPTNQAVDASGASVTVAVTIGDGCRWTASSNASWISVANGSGTGNGTVALAAAATDGPGRSGTVTIAGRTFTLAQASGCAFAISPNLQGVAPIGGGGSTTVTTGVGCVWTAVSNNPDWLTVTSGGSGSGSGTVSYTATANLGGGRTGTLTIGGQVFFVLQSALLPGS